MQIDITQLVSAQIALASIVITTFVVPWIKSKTTLAQQDQLKAWVKIAVSAAEMLYAGEKRGEEKKEYVIAWLSDRGITFDEATVDAAIEAAVYGLKR